MRNRTKVSVAVMAAATAVASAGTAAALASTTGGHAPAASASHKPDSSKAAQERQAHDAMSASVAAQLHLSTAQVSTALQPLFAAGEAEPSSPVLATAAHSLGVSTQQLYDALVHAKKSLASSMPAQPGHDGSKARGAKAHRDSAAQEQQSQNAMTAAVAAQLHVSTARVSGALRPIFAAGYADPSSSVFAAAARSLGVSTQQLAAALGSAKQSLAQSAGA